MANPIIYSLVVSLALTLALELIMALIWRVKDWHDILLLVLVNVMTNPPVVLTHNLIMLDTPIFFTIAIEAMVVALEFLCYKYRARTINKPFVFSLSTNAFSYISGLFLMRLIYGG